MSRTDEQTRADRIELPGGWRFRRLVSFSDRWIIRGHGREIYWMWNGDDARTFAAAMNAPIPAPILEEIERLVDDCDFMKINVSEARAALLAAISALAAERDRLRDLIGVRSTAALRRRLRRIPLTDHEKAERELRRKLQGALADKKAAVERIEQLQADFSAVSAAIGSVRFMDPPDGGSVSLAEQVRRMRQALQSAEDAAERIASNWHACSEHEEAKNARLREALEQIDRDCDRHTSLVGFAHNAPDRRELQERLDSIRAGARAALATDHEGGEG